MTGNIVGSELSFVDFVKFDGDFFETEDSTKLCKREFAKNVLENNGYLWNKLFLASIIKENNIRFYENIHNREDLVFVFEYLKYVKTVGQNRSKLYFYRLNRDGASNVKELTESKLTSCIAQGKLIEAIEKDNNYDDYVKRFVVEETVTLYSYYLKELLVKTSDFGLKRKWIPFIIKEYDYLEYNQKVEVRKNRTLKTKFYYLNLKVMVALFRILKNFSMHMDKQPQIAIYTLQGNNYGNRLQNYAMQSILEKRGFKVVSLSNKEVSNPILSVICRHNFTYHLFLSMKRIIRSLLKNDSANKFNDFNSKIHLTSDFIGKSNIKIRDSYYAIIAGSDQIWNTTFDWLSSNSFLPFSHPRKISFSASFGVESIPYDEQIVDCLNDFKALSVREEAGAKIIKDLTGRDATVLVDPTMILTKEEWRKVSKKPKGAKEGYILTYFLSPKCDEAQKKLAEIRGNKEVHELLNSDDRGAGVAGPSEFLWLFEHANIILTDSFHACVFSFLFNKPFIVYDRTWNEGNMNSRLDTLLSTFHLERKYAGSGLPNDIWEHDYTEGYKQLEIERKKASDFLKKALED